MKMLHLLLLSLTLASSGALVAADPEYTIRSNPSEVRVLFTAEDAEGHRITRLDPNDVAVIDNEEVVRRFRSFGPASEVPLDVVILIDTSSSVSKQIKKELELVAAFLRGASWREGDQVSIVSFGGPRANIVCKSTCRDQRIAFSEVAAGGGTPLYDAVIAALAIIAETRSENSRAAIVLISDGMDTYSYHGPDTAISAAQQAEASLYAINSRAGSEDGAGGSTLGRMAAETGGRLFPEGRDTGAILSAVVDELRQGFLLTYQLPRSASVRHEMRVVAARNPKLRFRSRTAYNEPERASLTGER
jgi:VWFA-related protein